MEERRQLPQSLEESNLAKGLFLRESIAEDITKPSNAMPAVLHLRTLHRYSVNLRDPRAARAAGRELLGRELLGRALFDRSLLRQLEDCGWLNWCKHATTLAPLKNGGKGNSLLDAVSLYMWGVRDTDLVLRTALYNTMHQNSHADLHIAGHRWQSLGGHSGHYTACRMPMSNEEWKAIVKVADPRSEVEPPPIISNQDIYLFVLANIIRRPIIVLGGSTEEAIDASSNTPAGPAGIYLPLLWDSEKCYGFPVVLGCVYPFCCFTPLLSNSPSAPEIEALPLVIDTKHRVKELPVHFLPEPDQSTKQQSLRKYLHLSDVFFGDSSISVARLESRNLPENLNLVQDYFKLVNYVCAQLSHEMQGAQDICREQENQASSTCFSITKDKCATEHCLYFASKYTWPYCHECREASHGRALPPKPPSAKPGHREGWKDTREYSSGSCFYGDRPAKVQLPAGPASAPSAPFSPAHPPESRSQGSSSQPQRTNPSQERKSTVHFDPCQPSGNVSPQRTEGKAVRPVPLHDEPCEGTEALLCGRCIACKKETRTFNGLCFKCLQTEETSNPREEAEPSLSPKVQDTGSQSERQFMERCITPGCMYFGTFEHNGYCTLCYFNQDRAPASRSQVRQQETPADPPPQISSILRKMPKCSAPGCNMLETPGFNSFCEKCFLTHNKGTLESELNSGLTRAEPSIQLYAKEHLYLYTGTQH
ncbi:tumor necrosis factor alpha-induced protein 3 isoform X2 [Amia ocellicauda]|uniref:tumor necrosis factor alpha-induced protein 3 isoform X2 n=1 Tax=Amia ocellicauda TaxID=2972642 RepID=UPI0034645C8B